MRSYICACSFLLVFHLSSLVHAQLTIHDSRFTAEQRLNGLTPSYPMAIDGLGTIYSVTSTALGADLIRIDTDNTITTLNSNIGHVVGVMADMEIGFGGDFFANYALPPNSAAGTHGVLRFDRTTGAAAPFFSGAGFNGDGGLAFDSNLSVLYMQSQLPNAHLLSINSVGVSSTLIENLGESRGLALESSGTLITIGQTLIRRIDPINFGVTDVLDISTDLPGYNLRSVDILSTGEIAFTAQDSAAEIRALYSVSASGGTLNLIATDAIVGPHQIKFGTSRDGLGHSLYINNPNTFTLHELRFNSNPAQVDSTFVYHRNWTGEGGGIDYSKQMHREGGGYTLLSFANLINSSHGINGLGFDLKYLPDDSDLTMQDFEFQMSPQGSFSEVLNPPQSWPSAPSPMSFVVTTLSEEDSVDRALLEWQDNQIENRWLRIKVKANENTGLLLPQVYYIGHLRGETSGADGASYTVSFADITAIRLAVGSQVNASSVVDIDKNGVVSFADIAAMRDNVGTILTNITVQ